MDLRIKNKGALIKESSLWLIIKIAGYYYNPSGKTVNYLETG